MTKQIVIIEDQEIILDSLVRRFRRRGFKVIGTRHPEEAIQVLLTETVDVVVSDINLETSLSGVDVFLAVRQGGGTVPFLFLTGHGETSHEVRCAVENGAEAVMSKPVEFALLFEKVCSILQVAQRGDANLPERQ